MFETRKVLTTFVCKNNQITELAPETAEQVTSSVVAGGRICSQTQLKAARVQRPIPAITRMI